MMKISVIVPTYATAPEGLARLVDSLDRQTMPSGEFEVVFVDDGSPDDTLDRLRIIQSDRDNVRVERIENSGWPSRPRNVGIELARGDYVLFMDHDDVLYPDALRAAYELAHASGSDVLSGKESRTDDPAWAFDVYTADEPQALGRKGPHPLLPMNPHKLYRRQLLIDHGIRFPEGRLVLWEDITFNTRVARHAKVMSRLSSVPFYHWVTTEGSGTSLFDKSSEHYWKMLRELCETIDAELGSDELHEQHEQFIRVQYTSRVLGAFNVGYLKRSPRARDLIFREARQIREDFGLSRFDDSLSVSVRLRAQLLDDGRQDMLERLSAEDVTIAGWGTATDATWHEGKLHIDVKVEWSSAHGRRPALGRRGEGIVKILSPEVAADFADDDLDVAREVAGATLALAVRNREDKVTWAAPSEWSVTTADDDHGVVVEGSLSSVIDINAAAFGAALPAGHWDLQARARLGSAVVQRNLRSDVAASMTIAHDRLHLVYTNDGGTATIIPDGAIEAVRRLTPSAAKRLDDGRVRIELCGMHDGSGSMDTTVGVDVSNDLHKTRFVDRPATIEISNGRAVLIVDAPSSVVRLRIGDRAGRRPEFWTLFVTQDRVDLNVGQLPKVRTAEEVAADLVEQQQTAAAKADAAAKKLEADDRKAAEREAARAAKEAAARRPMRRLRRLAGRTLRRLGLR